VFKTTVPAKIPSHIDLDTIRETLLYIESDFRDCVALARVSAALSVAIEEIERLEALQGSSRRPEIVAAHFLPAGL
jgi:hypothetical protein